LPVEFSGLAEAALEIEEFGAEELEERRKKRGMKRTASRIAAMALTRMSLLERWDTGAATTRRGPPIVAFTCGSEETGMLARVGCVEVYDRDGGDTGESGTASGSICGSGWRDVLREDEGTETAAT